MKLSRFLQENDAYDAFVNNYRENGSRGDDSISIVNAFHWLLTPEGNNYWSNLDTLWFSKEPKIFDMDWLLEEDSNIEKQFDENVAKAQKAKFELKKQHPLLNPDSRHYSMVDGVESIQRLEEMYTQDELMSWAKITAMKYRMRIGHKDDPTKEVAKIRTFEAYYKYLEETMNGE